MEGEFAMSEVLPGAGGVSTGFVARSRGIYPPDGPTSNPPDVNVAPDEYEAPYLPPRHVPVPPFPPLDDLSPALVRPAPIKAPPVPSDASSEWQEFTADQVRDFRGWEADHLGPDPRILNKSDSSPDGYHQWAAQQKACRFRDVLADPPMFSATQIAAFERYRNLGARFGEPPRGYERWLELEQAHHIMEAKIQKFTPEQIEEFQAHERYLSSGLCTAWKIAPEGFAQWKQQQGVEFWRSLIETVPPDAIPQDDGHFDRPPLGIFPRFPFESPRPPYDGFWIKNLPFYKSEPYSVIPLAGGGRFDLTS